ncbi:ribosome maturation factor RimM [Thiomicrospira microaerophila]|uniref:ribosome maturation factor RimM n=1 Tax=Thiomicrospira microaerophila TaxID=406020 RepID=UPI002010AC47|nr:ribosome maturation factor RimM [Thiomicrospira microaerophila]UQB42945.1 ribosome maturation factor RimM [Thiomicrospira microaerophila]
MDNEKLILGRINGVYGVKGWVKIYSHTDPVGNILSYQPWWVKRQGQWVEMKVIESHAPQGGKAIVAHLESVNSREQARELMGSDIAVMREQLPDDEDGFYWTDLIGCQVENSQGLLLGEVIELVETGAHDVLRVKGDMQILIPFVWDVYVLDVDLDKRLIKVDWQPEEVEQD